MKSIPGSYDDFVNSMTRWMERDGSIRDAVLEKLRVDPDSDTCDILEVLCDCLGVGEPLELIDDEEETHKPSRRPSKPGRVAVF